MSSPDKSDPYARRWLAARYIEAGMRSAHMHGAPGESGNDALPDSPSVPVLLEVSNPAWIAPPGVQVTSRLDEILVARVTGAGLAALEHDDAVLRIESSREGSTPEVTVTAARREGGSVRPHQLTEEGEGALIAIIDTGIDVKHRCFFDRHGASRIVGIWDQTQDQESGIRPEAMDPRYAPPYGAFYDRSMISELLDDTRFQLGVPGDPHGHGTHVASIAAGRPVGDFAGGVAPGAAILIVITRLDGDTLDPRSIGYSAAHADALSFIARFADAHGYPVVVNVSQGMNAGAHDGSTLLEAAFDDFTRGGRRPGRAIVKSAGNEFGAAGHAHVAIGHAVETVTWRASSVPRSQDYLEAWFDSGLALKLTLIGPDGTRSPAVSNENPEIELPLSGHRCFMKLTRFHRDNGDSRLVIVIDRKETLASERWQLEVVPCTVPRPGDLHLWAERDSARAIQFEATAGDVNGLTLSIPGTAHTVITVGACGAGEPLMLTSSSSKGPTRDRRNKPDLVAPGEAIVAARAGTRAELVAMTGTSMAAPHVAGAIALLFSRQRRGGLPLSNAAQIRAALTCSARSGGSWHPRQGYGRLDIPAFLELLSPTGAEAALASVEPSPGSAAVASAGQ